MIRSPGVQIWTSRGWMGPDKLIIGDKVISYNSQRNCTEYDTINYIFTDYKSYNFLGIKSKTFLAYLTRDHPVIIYDEVKNESYRTSIDDIFYKRFGNRAKSMLINSWFEPYDFNQNESDIIWSARIASSFSRVKYMPVEYKEKIWSIIRDLNGYQAQQWITEVFCWNRLLACKNWMFAMRLYSIDLHAMIFHVGMKAGLGVSHKPPPNGWKFRHYIIQVTDTNNASPVPPHSYFQRRETNYSFNVGTKNGSVLVRYRASTFLLACDIKESK